MRKKFSNLVVITLSVLLLSGCVSSQTPTDPSAKLPSKPSETSLTERDAQKAANEKDINASEEGNFHSSINTDKWKTYKNSAYGISFRYPMDFKIEDTNKKNGFDNSGLYLTIADKNGYRGEINHLNTTFYNPPEDVNLEKWIRDNGANYEPINARMYSNKPGSDFEIAGLPTVHLVNRRLGGSIYDAFYVLKDDKIFEIRISSEYDQDQIKSSKDVDKVDNLDLSDPDTWEVNFLNSISFQGF